MKGLSNLRSTSQAALFSCTSGSSLNSGIRLGTPAVTTRGMKEGEMAQVGDFIAEALENHTDEDKLAKIKGQVEELCTGFPVPGINV